MSIYRINVDSFTLYKSEFKVDQRLLELLEEKHGSSLEDIGVGKNFVNSISIGDNMKIKVHSKETISRATSRGGGVFANYTSD